MLARAHLAQLLVGEHAVSWLRLTIESIPISDTLIDPILYLREDPSPATHLPHDALDSAFQPLDPVTSFLSFVTGCEDAQSKPRAQLSKWNDDYHVIAMGVNMGQIVKFVSRSERERNRMIEEARAIYDSVFPPTDPISERSGKVSIGHAGGGNPYRSDRGIS